MSRWFNATGGLRYHLRARKFRTGLWAPFVAGVGEWLARWQPAEREILLVGPSAGHCLTEPFVARWERVTAVDPDPLARWLFTRRFGPALRARGAELVWDAQDYFGPGARGFDPTGLERLLRAHPGAAVLFCNFLGQMALLDEREVFLESFAQWKRALPGVLAGRAFASFHDRVSGAAGPEFEGVVTAVDGEGTGDLVERFYVGAAANAVARGGDLELVDHRTEGLFPGEAREYLAWELYPGWWHLVECVARG